jgi:hypothetical protein
MPEVQLEEEKTAEDACKRNTFITISSIQYI